mmetsp:Transcript_42988/g.69752  ORF Transcript_42988/g.69752 Transcript_42988/m.69752 type:complete len:139 (-) Transcript_42988:654-1070(-)
MDDADDDFYTPEQPIPPGTAQPATPRIKTISFSNLLSDIPVHFHILCLVESFFIWVGVSPPRLARMDAAFPAKFDPFPTTTTLFGKSTDDSSLALAGRLVKKFGKPFFVSLTLPPESSMLPLVEKRLVQELQKETIAP